MKNIIILDVYANYIQAALDTGEINISMAMVESHDMVNKCRERFGDKIQNYYYRVPLTNEEFDKLNESDYNLTYEDIEKYRATQLKCEHYLHREISDIGVMQYRYLMALRFWLGFYEKII